jgi:hypothetical protein
VVLVDDVFLYVVDSFDYDWGREMDVEISAGGD